VREGCGIECNLFHHVDPVPHIIHAHLVDDHVHQKVCCLNLELGCFEVSLSCLNRRIAIKKNQNCDQNLNHEQHKALIEEISKILVRELVLPLVLKSHRKEGGAVHVGVVLEPHFFWRWSRFDLSF
jgi:hypothetical protein